MKALLVVAHGSRRAASNDEVRQLTECMRRKSEGRFGIVHCAFLELAEPSIPDGIEHCINAGATHITVLPYFLSAGRHVAKDIPEEVAPKREAHPEVTIEIAPYLGAAESIPDLMLSMVD